MFVLLVDVDGWPHAASAASASQVAVRFGVALMSLKLGAATVFLQ
jgi:hypothetical protein